MIVDSHSLLKAGDIGRAVHIDEDRRIAAFEDSTGGFLIKIHNGPNVHRLAVTREAAEALWLVLGTVLGAEVVGVKA